MLKFVPFCCQVVCYFIKRFLYNHTKQNLPFGVVVKFGLLALKTLEVHMIASKVVSKVVGKQVHFLRFSNNFSDQFLFFESKFQFPTRTIHSHRKCGCFLSYRFPFFFHSAVVYKVSVLLPRFR